MRTRASLLSSLVDEARRKSQDFLGSVILPESLSNSTSGTGYGSGSAGSRFMETVRKALSSAKNSTLSKNSSENSNGNGNNNSNGNGSFPSSNNNSIKLRHHNSVNGSPVVDNSSSSTLQVGTRLSLESANGFWENLIKSLELYTYKYIGLLIGISVFCDFRAFGMGLMWV